MNIQRIDSEQLKIAKNAEVSLKMAGNTAQVTFTAGKNKKCPFMVPGTLTSEEGRRRSCGENRKGDRRGSGAEIGAGGRTGSDGKNREENRRASGAEVNAASRTGSVQGRDAGCGAGRRGCGRKFCQEAG